ncbi:MAG: UDP-N-acetylmuramoyl-tripeptide--D-alanyl-D-alanine ligase [Salinivirgaceae bacterium]|jgi:UDP-N-acetylmuramoyl-tripeptide--D-alanyl-D-alanine ligase|nr:UDP-N-acetylmuramoyl-tripeptide--D-alanyl-D-alanine ligase [Salinivirgaceae bacterium]
MNTPELYELFQKFPKVCTDSRFAESGSIFFALKGANFDGNKYASKALDKCEYAVVDNPEVVKNDKYILVDDTLIKLQRLAKYHRKRLGLPIVAITGTNGKTTTKELVAAVMSKKYKVGYTRGNLNNHIGVPLTLLSFTTDHEFGIIEMGANHIGEIALLCKIAAPDFGVVTNVGKAHLEGFGSFEGVKKAKAELYNYLYEYDGVAFVNYDNELLEDMKPPHSVIYYGTKGFTHCQGHIEGDGKFLSLRWIGADDSAVDDNLVDWKEKGNLVQTKLYGNYNFENVMAAICIGENFNIDNDKIKEAIEAYSPENYRSQLVETGLNTLIVDSYNANPTSMKAALENFNEIKLNNKVVILGDMLELGNVDVREHGVIIALLANMKFEKVILVGEVFCNYSDQKNIEFFKTSKELEIYFKENKLSGKNILIKGSRGMKLENAIKNL